MVVHSGGFLVLHDSFTPGSGHMTATFHAQLVDLENILLVGTFFAMTALTQDLGFLRGQVRASCTELSTLCVDKDKNPFEPAVCGRFLAGRARTGRKSRLMSAGHIAGALLQ
jgi:hypothetical protein